MKNYIIALSFLLLLTGCGVKGDLYLNNSSGNKTTHYHMADKTFAAAYFPTS